MRGLDSAEMARCPGYRPEVTAIGADRLVGQGHSCLHLRAQRDLRRPAAYVPACTHPTLAQELRPRPGDDPTRRRG